MARRRRCSHYERIKGLAKPIPSCSKDGLHGGKEERNSPRRTSGTHRSPSVSHARSPAHSTVPRPSALPCSLPPASTGSGWMASRKTGCHHMGSRRGYPSRSSVLASKTQLKACSATSLTGPWAPAEILWDPASSVQHSQRTVPLMRVPRGPKVGAPMMLLTRSPKSGHLC